MQIFNEKNWEFQQNQMKHFSNSIIVVISNLKRFEKKHGKFCSSDLVILIFNHSKV